MLTVSVDVKVPGIIKFSRVMAGGMVKGSDPAVDAMFVQWGKRYERFARSRFTRLSRGAGGWRPLAMSTILARRYGKGGTRGGAQRRLNERIGRLNVQIGNDQIAASKLGGSLIAGARLQRAIRRSNLSAKRFQRVQELSTKSFDLGTMKGVAILRDTGVLFAAMQIGSTGNQYDRIPFGARYGFRPLPHGSGTSKSIQRIAGYHQQGGRHLPQRRIIVQPDAVTTRGMANDAGRAMRAMLSARGGAT